MKADILDDIYRATEQAIAQGVPFKEFKKNLTPLLEKKGWIGTKEVKNPRTGKMERVELGTPRWLKTIYETNLDVAYKRGRYESMRDNVENRPYWQYVCRMLPTSREAHRALHLKVFRYDDPIWNTLFPPNGFGCQCSVRALTAAEVEKKGLKVEKSELVPVDRALAPGVIQRVTGYRNPATGEIAAPDAGWNYNPGISHYTPDMRKYSEFVRSLLEAAITNPAEATITHAALEVTNQAIKNIAALARNLENKELEALIQKVMDEAQRNGKKEVMGIFNAKVVKEKTSLFLGSEGCIPQKDDFLKLLTDSEDNTLLIVHNHPEGGGLSIRDMTTFMENKSIKQMIVVDNNGKAIYSLKKHNTVSPKVEDEFKNILEERRLTKAVEFLQKNSTMQGGIVYEKFK